MNTGHELYALGAGDPWHADPSSPPLLSPPLVGVIWRPLAALGWLGIAVWVATVWAASLLTIGVILRRTAGWGGVLLIVLSVPILLAMGVGNLDALMMAGAVGVWLLVERGHDRAIGLVVGLIASLKLAPIVLLVWLLSTRRWTAVAWTLGTCIVLAVVAMLGSRLDILVEYLAVRWAAPGSALRYVAIAAGCAVIVLFGRRWPRATFALAIALMPLAALQLHSWVVMVAALAPVRELRAIDTAEDSQLRREPGFEPS
jgi:hypothetical protein